MTGRPVGDYYLLKTSKARVYHSSSGRAVPPNAFCSEAAAFCTDSPIVFPASVDNGGAETGPDYDCLSSQPNPTWYYMEIVTPGSMTIDMTNSNVVDIDFAIWGPFAPGTTNDAACAQISGGALLPANCSFSGGAAEQANITAVESGEIWMLLITNYSNDPTDISFTKSAGSATANCQIINDPSIPTVGEWGMIIMGLLTLIAGTIIMRKQPVASARV